MKKEKPKIKTKNFLIFLSSLSFRPGWRPEKLSHHFPLFKFRAGFTLIETVVALSVITAAMVGPVYLITRSLFSSSFSRNKLIANNLAQEGLEAIRAVRENNVICSFLQQDLAWGWLTNSNAVGSLIGSNLKVDTTQFDLINCGGNSLQNPRVSPNCNEPFKIDANSRYNYVAGPDSIFQRCLDISNPAGNEGPIPPSDIADVTVTVTWNERGVNKSTLVKGRLYNWK